MRKLNAWIYVALDGVVEAPENWVIPDDEMFGANETDYAAADALLLGRRTYEVFAASWPQRSSDVANADWMNGTPPVPPEDVAHLLPALLFHVAVPLLLRRLR